MVARTFQKTDAGILALVEEPIHLVVFVHGFNFKGNKDRNRARTYWQTFGALALDEPMLDRSNFAFFDYPSNPSLIPRKTSLLGGTLGCAPIPEVVHLLKSTIKYNLKVVTSGEYTVLAHSLGAHIALKAISEIMRSQSEYFPKSVNLLAAPNKPHWLARLHRTASLHRNPQTSFLGSKEALEDNLDSRIAEIRESARAKNSHVPIRHMHSLGDPFVAYDPTSKFDESEICNQKHTPFDGINSTTDRQYKKLIEWIIS